MRRLDIFQNLCEFSLTYISVKNVVIPHILLISPDQNVSIHFENIKFLVYVFNFVVSLCVRINFVVWFYVTLTHNQTTKLNTYKKTQTISQVSSGK